MDLDLSIKQKIEALASQYNFKELYNANNSILDKYQNNETNKNINNKIKALAYGITRFPATFNAVISVLENININKFNIKSMLDFGAGSGASSLALLNMISNVDCKLLETSENMIELGKYIFKDTKYENQIEYKTLNVIKDNYKFKADLVICSYMLNECNDTSKIDLIKKIYDSSNDLIIVIEPGTKLGFDNIKLVRSELLKLNANIIAPCLSNAPCKLDSDNWCHFTCRVSRSKLHMQLKDAEVPYEDEKFSYIVFSKKYINDINVHEYGRILRHPIIEPKKISLNLCTNNDIKQVTIFKSNIVFKTARKSKCGDLININGKQSD